MSDEMREIRERQVEWETRLKGVERAVAEVTTAIRRLSQLLRGNGEEGLFGQLQLTRERIQGLQRQWRWVFAFLAALVVGVVQALVRK